MAIRKIMGVLCLLVGGCPFTYAGGLPVFDGLNYANGLRQTAQIIDQVKRQIEQYQTQLQQFENEKSQYDTLLQNTRNLKHFNWDDAENTINKLLELQNQMNYYQQQAGSLNNWLEKYQDAGYYSTQPCFNGSGCTDAERNALQEKQQLSSTAKKRANDALFKIISRQQKNMAQDSQQLTRLQQGATSADGQMKALQYANQLASEQANQLLEIRSLLLAQQNMLAVVYQQQMDKQAQQEAAEKQALSGDLSKPSPHREWR
jgi:P-type conjugative transfer protein TrbJ